jgi:hypothetical protein
MLNTAIFFVPDEKTVAGLAVGDKALDCFGGLGGCGLHHVQGNGYGRAGLCRVLHDIGQRAQMLTLLQGRAACADGRDFAGFSVGRPGQDRGRDGGTGPVSWADGLHVDGYGRRRLASQYGGGGGLERRR